MAGLIQGLTDKIVSSIMDQLKDRLPYLAGKAPAVSSFVREETYVHPPPPVRTNNEPPQGKQSHHEALASGTAAPAQATDVVAPL
ncbi:hypothetical protein LIER_21499 [Lithospermum erythrorhizon]|uniref:Uncharacterized protein n=1 Tax=Lithospermum erythrorhizon TaxID=34254 RepID=A0AAV3QSX2_LITER